MRTGAADGEEANCVSRHFGPPMTSIASRTSSTLLAMGPATSKSPRMAGNPFPRGTIPRDGFRPTRPVCAAGLRIEPPPSVQSATAPMLDETPATAPPLDPPGVKVAFHGLPVVPNNRLWV